jgi:hypothetical protein
MRDSIRLNEKNDVNIRYMAAFLGSASGSAEFLLVKVDAQVIHLIPKTRRKRKQKRKQVGAV